MTEIPMGKLFPMQSVSYSKENQVFCMVLDYSIIVKDIINSQNLEGKLANTKNETFDISLQNSFEGDKNCLKGDIQ